MSACRPACSLAWTTQPGPLVLLAALRPGEGNVAHSIHLLRDDKRGLVVPVLAVSQKIKAC